MHVSTYGLGRARLLQQLKQLLCRISGEVSLVITDRSRSEMTGSCYVVNMANDLQMYYNVSLPGPSQQQTLARLRHRRGWQWALTVHVQEDPAFSFLRSLSQRCWCVEIMDESCHYRCLICCIETFLLFYKYVCWLSLGLWGTLPWGRWNIFLYQKMKSSICPPVSLFFRRRWTYPNLSGFLHPRGLSWVYSITSCHDPLDTPSQNETESGSLWW